MSAYTLGILGGLGPMSSVYFCEMLTERTKADCDQQHINFLLSSRADTPDRTDFILGRSSADPSPVMIEEVGRLTGAGADVIAIPCNTAHHFYDAVAEACPVPVINIIDQTVDFCLSRRFSKVGVLATEGTVASKAYETALARVGIEYATCNEREQSLINDVIYKQIKRGLPPDADGFLTVANALRARGCEALILGCTELSLLKRKGLLDNGFIDSLEVLALSAIRLCGKEPQGFDAELMNFYPNIRKEPKYVID